MDLIYYHHVAAFVVPLNLKKLNFDFLTQTQSRRDGVCGKNMFYFVAAFVISLNLICNMTMF